MKDYMKILAKHHAGVKASMTGDASVYANIDWHDTPISEASLDTHALAYEKELKDAAIDLKTQSLIDAGFTYDSIVFSMSEMAQLN